MNVNTKLKWTKFSGNHQYLTSLVDSWMRWNEVSRTSVNEQQEKIDLLLTDEENNCYSVSFPDLSGERFQNEYKNREMNIKSVQSIRKADGILLFVNPSHNSVPDYISDMPEELRGIDDSAQKMRDPFDDPTEVQLVELLQFVSVIRSNKSVNLVIIVSAWDLIENTYQKPQDYIEKELPLLFQYVFCNNIEFNVSFYGVSAQGGKLTNNDERIELCEKFNEDHKTRIKVVNQYGELNNDLSLPIWQAMN